MNNFGANRLASKVGPGRRPAMIGNLNDDQIGMQRLSQMAGDPDPGPNPGQGLDIVGGDDGDQTLFIIALEFGLVECLAVPTGCI